MIVSICPNWRSRATPVAAGLLLAASVFAAEPGAGDSGEIRVMTFNLWHGGDAGQQPLSQSADVIRLAGADLVGLQETAGFAEGGPRPDRAAQLAELLGLHYLDQGRRCGLLSRWPILKHTPERHGARIDIPGEREVWLFNVHFAHAPYQPYQLLRIPYEGGRFIQTADDAVAEARAARGHQVRALLDEMRGPLERGAMVFLTGDLNEPSHQDWTPAAANAGLCPLPVVWPTTRALTDAGLRDSYRVAHPEPVNRPGWTWTPVT
jgi:exodeoxyribonuclease III